MKSESYVSPFIVSLPILSQGGADRRSISRTKHLVHSEKVSILADFFNPLK